MKYALFFVCFLGLLAASSAFPFAQWLQSQPWLNMFGMGRTECVRQGSLGFEEKLEKIFQYNDASGDGVVQIADFVYDVVSRYDTNVDGEWTAAECIRRNTCTLGDPTPVATFTCNGIMGGAPSVSIRSFYDFPMPENGISKADFKQMNRARYEEFERKRCLDRCLSTEEKLALNARNNDHDGDGLVTLDDIKYDLTTFYDDDKDGRVTRDELVVRWICNYGDSTDYARYIWGMFFGEVDSVDIDNLLLPGFEIGVPVEDFKQQNRQNYANFAELFGERECEDATSKWSWG